jgi:putative membrane protein
MVAWFAGLFYLPRLFVNHAMAESDSEKARLALMERKLYRFIQPWMGLTVLFGIWLLIDYAWAAYTHMLWLHVKLLLVALLIVYHFYCGKLLRDFAAGKNRRSHVWYRWFNELPVLVLFAAVILAVVKPF